MSKLPVIINRAGGSAAASGESLHDSLETAFTNNGGAASIELVDGKGLQQAFAQFSEAKMIVVGGGDGTAASAAGALAHTPTNLALLPLGTLNHLARDLSIPSDLNDAVKLALKGKAKAIDLGNVNEHRFVNNASIGLYPSMVTRREEIRDRHNLQNGLRRFSPRPTHSGICHSNTWNLIPAKARSACALRFYL
jgi:diacylglycerol kinase family enzyme